MGMDHGIASPPLGRRLRSYRRICGLTASELAAKSGVSENAIRKIESGHSKQPSFATGVRIAEALGISPRTLAFGEMTPDGEPPNLAVALARMRENRAELTARGVRRIAVFGSVARGDATPGSDVDILIEPEPDHPFSAIILSRVALLLESALGRRVDVVTLRSVHSERYANIRADAVYAF